MEFIGVDIPIWTLLMPVALLLLYMYVMDQHAWVLELRTLCTITQIAQAMLLLVR